MFSQANFERDMFKLNIVSPTHVFRYSARLCDNQDVSKVEWSDEKPEEISVTFVKGDSKEGNNGKEEEKKGNLLLRNDNSYVI